MLRVLRKEIGDWRRDAQVVGRREATIRRARHHLGLVGVDGERLQSVDARIAELSVQLTGLAERVLDLGHQIEEARAYDEFVREGLDQAAIRLTHQIWDLRGELRATEHELGDRIRAVDRRATTGATVDRIRAVTEWVQSATVAETTPISVILPTRNRCQLLQQAVATVAGQAYANWELVVVDDASTDGTRAYLDRLTAVEPRVVVVAGTGRGVAAARAAGLAAASGEVICYLDDDNVMLPLWLKAVAWAFQGQPGLEVLYGARLLEGHDEGFPGVHFEPFDRRNLESRNFVDMGTIAHRRGLPEARFDEELPALVDWDLILRLTESVTPYALPVTACAYSLGAPDRISRAAGNKAGDEMLRMGMKRRYPLRVLAYNSLYPLVSETYIGEEIKAFSDNGAVVAWYTDIQMESPVTLREPVFTDVDKAIEVFDPDLLFIHWASFAHHQLSELTRIGRPFGLRVHSFDFDVAMVEEVRDHRLCIGVWAYPHHSPLIAGARDLLPLVTTISDFPEPVVERSTVLAATPGLPKKDWPLLVDAFAQLARDGVDCRIATGLTFAHEDDIPELVQTLIAESGAKIDFSLNVPHEEVIASLARTAIVVYTLSESKVQFGMPRSLVEGMCAGTSVVLPDRPEAELVCGPGRRLYRTADDIVAHVKEVLAGGPAIEAEQAANREWARGRYADPQLGRRFTYEVLTALAEWRERHGC